MLKKMIRSAIPFVLAGAVIGISMPASYAADANSPEVQKVLDKRLQNYVNSQKPFPYGIFQYTDRGLLNALTKHPEKFALIDVRTPTFHDFYCGMHSNKHVCTGRGWKRVYGYQQGHVPGAVNVPYLDLATATEKGEIPKNKIVVFMCPTGQLSNQVAGVYRMLGYDAYALRGGVNGWTGHGYPTVIGKKPGTFAQACHPWQTCWRQFHYDNPQAH